MPRTSCSTATCLRTTGLLNRGKTLRCRSTVRKPPDAERVFPEHQLAIFFCVEVAVLIHELQFFVHRQRPNRPWITRSPHELPAAELFMNRLVKRQGLEEWIGFRCLSGAPR